MAPRNAGVPILQLLEIDQPVWRFGSAVRTFGEQFQIYQI